MTCTPDSQDKRLHEWCVCVCGWLNFVTFDVTPLTQDTAHELPGIGS